MKIYTDIYDRFIRAELDKKDSFKEGSLRTSSLGLENEGIYCIVGSTEADKVNISIHSFLFNKDKFNVEQVKAWLEKARGEFYEEEVIEPSNSSSKINNEKISVDSNNVGIRPTMTYPDLDKSLKISSSGNPGIGTGGHDAEFEVINEKFNELRITSNGDFRMGTDCPNATLEIVKDELNILTERNDNMPIKKGKDKVGHFAQWGDKGKKYYFDPENKSSETKAEDKAKLQGKAIEAGDSSSKSFNLNDMNLNRTLFLFEQFHQESAEKLVKELLELDAEATDDINILINSFGGYTNALTAILDTMGSLKSKVNTICLGEADSCGAVLLVSGNDRFIGKQSRTMIHEVGTMAWGKISEIEKGLEDAKAVNEMIIDVLSSKSDQDRDILANIIKEDTFLSAKESVSFGLVDGILSGEEEFIVENELERLKLNASNLDTFIFNKLKNTKQGSLASEQEQNKNEGENEMSEKDKNEVQGQEETNEEVINAVEPTVDEIPAKSKNEELLETLASFANDPAKLVNFLDEATKVNTENAKKLAEFEAKENARRKEELDAFAKELKNECKVLPTEMGLVKPILDSLDDTTEIEYSYSEYGVKEKATALGIFKKFLNNLPNRGLFGQVSEVTEESDYNAAIEHFSQKLFNKSSQDCDSTEFKAVLSAIKKDPKTKRLL